MSKKKIKLPPKEWEETINKLSYDELESYLSDKEICYPKFLELVENRLNELKISEIREFLIKFMAKHGTKNEFDEDGYLYFSLNIDNKKYLNTFSKKEMSYLKDVNFCISLTRSPYRIEIYEECWKSISLDNTSEVEIIKSIMNDANCFRSVSTFYLKNSEEHKLDIYCMTNFPFIPNESYLADFLDAKIMEILFANRTLNHLFEVERAQRNKGITS